MQSPKKVSATISFTGIVQGVGFRPFIYRLAKRLALTGYVRNLGDAGVEAFVEGAEDNVRRFVRALQEETPPVCEITDVRYKLYPYEAKFSDFLIQHSRSDRQSHASVLPPDIGICRDCSANIADSRSRWHDYAFTCCASCGPRFTSVLSLPYDRERTSMDSFPLCEYCMAEYNDPSDRRFHAQGICCPTCGPSLTLYDRGFRRMSVDNPVVEAASLIDEGAIVAIKGIGGVHVSCAATNDGPLKRLRETKRKFFQPFAVMAKDVRRASQFAEVSEEEGQLLESWRKPIVILRKNTKYSLSDLVAPGLDTIGVMLPYTGIHLLLTSTCHELAIVMTSGNITGLPMSMTNESALRELSGFVDYFLLHNRDIVARCDDSVVRIVGNDVMFVRRSRGWVPTPVRIPFKSKATVVGVGAELRVVGGLLRGNRCYLTQHIGDADNLETVQFLEAALDNMASLTGIDLKGATVVRDMHPHYLTSRFATEFRNRLHGQLISVQHHHAHVASLMAEHGVPRQEEVVGVAADGVGYGVDGVAWGGEVLVCTYGESTRVGHLAVQPMPGGDLCTRYPLRMCAAMLKDYLEERRVRDFLLSWRGPGSLTESDLERLEAQMDSGTGLAWTSSVGRALDAFAALTGTCLVRTYEGEPAMRLEAAASRERLGQGMARVPSVGCTNVIDTSRFLYDMIGLLHETSMSAACRAYQEGLAKALAEIAVREATDRGVMRIGLTGGAAINTIITDTFAKIVSASGLGFMKHRLVPCGDGGVALGQVSVAAARL